ncbi:MAG TPA: 4-(cytidine 5'-diphospho)-2-C-methyl-D-erythritol kinase [Xanthobacteraceae bacterium]|nr:4-(cytidine 5'-diphospho)-2-C-methyl-D-erythritol kinase [Xanthobacteraceae bacterium]
MTTPEALVEIAPAKVNLTLRVLSRRSDGYHDLESLVAFADCGERLSFSPGVELSLTVGGPTATQAGPINDNLVIRAARALAGRIPDVRLGAFHLNKQLPAAAGLGGGSSDAAAALRLLVRANSLAADDPRLLAAARAVGSDVPVCLDPRTRLMRGVGEVLSPPIALPPLPAVLVNPGVALATKAVFAKWTPNPAYSVPLAPATIAKAASFEACVELLKTQSNDLEAPARALAPVIANLLGVLRGLPGCRLARMSGSGSTCYALFAAAAEAAEAARGLAEQYHHWWVRACVLGKAG